MLDELELTSSRHMMILVNVDYNNSKKTYIRDRLHHLKIIKTMKIFNLKYLFISLLVKDSYCTTGQETSDMHDLARIRAWIGKVKTNSAYQQIPVDRNALRGLETIFMKPNRPNRSTRRRNRYLKYWK